MFVLCVQRFFNHFILTSLNETSVFFPNCLSKYSNAPRVNVTSYNNNGRYIDIYIFDMLLTYSYSPYPNTPHILP